MVRKKKNNPHTIFLSKKNVNRLRSGTHSLEKVLKLEGVTMTGTSIILPENSHSKSASVGDIVNAEDISVAVDMSRVHPVRRWSVQRLEGIKL